MFSYLGNWVGFEKKEEFVSENFNNIEFVNNNNDIFNTNTYYGLDSDSDFEYDKIFTEKQSKLVDVYNDISSKLADPKEITKSNNQLKKNHEELVDKEKLVRDDRDDEDIDSNTVENIKIKNFESDVDDKLEIDNKMNQINLKLENVIGIINKIKFDTNEYMIKIIHLENLIKIHDKHRDEILLRLEKFNKEHVEMKKTNFQILNFQKCFLSDKSNYLGYLKYLGIGLGIGSCVIFSCKILKKN